MDFCLMNFFRLKFQTSNHFQPTTEAIFKKFFHFLLKTTTEETFSHKKDEKIAPEI